MKIILSRPIKKSSCNKTKSIVILVKNATANWVSKNTHPPHPPQRNKRANKNLVEYEQIFLHYLLRCAMTEYRGFERFPHLQQGKKRNYCHKKTGMLLAFHPPRSKKHDNNATLSILTSCWKPMSPRLATPALLCPAITQMKLNGCRTQNNIPLYFTLLSM